MATASLPQAWELSQPGRGMQAVMGGRVRVLSANAC